MDCKLVRADIVDILRACDRKWGDAALRKDSCALESVLTDLESVDCIAAEFREVKGLGTRTRASCLDVFCNLEVKNRVIGLLHKWMKLIDYEKRFEALVAELRTTYMPESLTTLFSACTVLIQNGLRSLDYTLDALL